MSGQFLQPQPNSTAGTLSASLTQRHQSSRLYFWQEDTEKPTEPHNAFVSQTMRTTVKSRHYCTDYSIRHLLGKKSWNVYNTANIEKVRKDEKDAAAREEAEEQRIQEVDAERRIRRLRGIRDEQSNDQAPGAVIEEKPCQHTLPRPPKRRRLYSEDDTDRDLRLAKHDMSNAPRALSPREGRSTTSNAPLVDASGHTNLFPVEGSRHRRHKNTDAEAEKAKKVKELEDQYTMRFSNAAGFNGDIGRAPWYQTSQALEHDKEDVLSKDVLGRNDSRRKERDQMRLEANDPLMMIKKGVKELRKAKEERKEWNKERMKELDESWPSRSKIHGRKRHADDVELDDFRLDDSLESSQRKSSHRKERHRSHRHRSGHEQSESRHRHRHHSSRLEAAR